MEFLSFIGLAFWIGILTSISPCPLATNIAAIFYVSHQVQHKTIVLFSGIFYTIGRCLTYIIIGFLVVQALISIPVLSNFLQKYMNQMMGFILILVGLFLLDLLKINILNFSPSEKIGKKLANSGMIGSFLLGALFALTFCPISAALFFGSLIPLSFKANSNILLPLIYGIGTGLPVLFFGIITSFGTDLVGKFYNKVTHFEYYTRKITGIIFILIGLYYVMKYVFYII